MATCEVSMPEGTIQGSIRTYPVIHPEVGDEVPDRHIAPSESLAEIIQECSYSQNTDV